MTVRHAVLGTILHYAGIFQDDRSIA